jgi:shikimate dehydrogenase
MHNAAFKHRRVNAVYLAFEPSSAAQALNAMRTLGMSGASVTIPFKEAVLPDLDDIDASARHLGAVNTIVNRNGKLKGYNTDGIGAVMALKQATKIDGLRVALLGAGGAARAIALALGDYDVALTIYNRSPERAKRLATDAGAGYGSLADVGKAHCDILINATPLGMSPLSDQMPIDPQQLNPSMLVMDTIYNPLKTRLVREAKTRGCLTIDGLEMFIQQGIRQFELWLRQPAPEKTMRQAVLAALTAAP